MIRNARYLRWLTLLISLAVEAAAFWYGGPPSDPQRSILGSIALKAASPVSWIWVGWAAFTLAWLIPEFVHFLYANGRRSSRLVDKGSGDELVYDTGLHWLVLLRDIHTGESIDGDEDELRQPLFVKDKQRSYTWFAVWVPVAVAAVTMLFFVGWAAWLVSAFPEQIPAWSRSARAFIEARLVGGLSFLAPPAESIVTVALQSLASLQEFGRANAGRAFLWLAGLWIALRMIGRAFRSVPVVSPLLRFVRWLTVLAAVFLLASLFDWLAPLYSTLPNNGLAAVGFIPLTYASIYYVWHVALWSSWRYAIIRDTKSHDASLVIVGGIFNFLKREFQIERIVDTRISQPWWKRLVGVGNLEIIEVGAGDSADFIMHIAGPNRLDRAIKDCIRTRRRRAAGINE